MIDKSKQQRRIDSKVSKRKIWLKKNFPVCIYCLHLALEGDASHLIRRSYASELYGREELQTMDINIWLAHRTCHDIFDNSPSEAVRMNNFWGVMQLIRFIEPSYCDQLMTMTYEPILKELEIWQPKWKKTTLNILYTIPGLTEMVNSGCLEKDTDGKEKAGFGL
jgi:hypothetical protein